MVPKLGLCRVEFLGRVVGRGATAARSQGRTGKDEEQKESDPKGGVAGSIRHLNLRSPERAEPSEPTL